MRVYILLLLMITGATFFIIQGAFAQSIGTERTPNDNKASTTSHSSYKKGITAGRARALAGGIIGLISLVIGWRAKNQSGRQDDNARGNAITALVFGSIGVILSIVHLAATSGAVFGSGSGKAGAIVALILSTVGFILGWFVIRKQKTQQWKQD